MGMTPIEGLIMGTRCGDVDAGALLHIANKEGIGIQTLNTLINKFSGVLGISGLSSDMRDLEVAAAEGNHRAALALQMYQYRVKKYIGAYAASLGGVDVIAFTGQIGSGSSVIREKILKDLDYLDFETEVIDADEELAIAQKLSTGL